MTPIHKEESHLSKAFHFRVVVCKHPVNTFSSELFPCGQGDILSSYARLAIIVFSFVQLKVNFQSFFPPLQCSYLSMKGWLSTQALFQRHLALHLPSHTHGSPGSFRGQPSYWAASLEQMGLRAKAVHWLLPFFIFLHSAHRRWNYASSCIDSGRQMEARQFRLSTGDALASAPSFMLHRQCLIHQLLRYQLNSNILIQAYKTFRILLTISHPIQTGKWWSSLPLPPILYPLWPMIPKP